MSSRQSVLATALVVFIAFSVWITYKAKRLDQSAPGNGETTSTLLRQPAPDFSLNTLDGEPVSLDQFRAKKMVVVSFWASWCGPCRAEMPSLAAFYQKNKDKGVEVLAISIDSEAAAARSFAHEQKLPFPVLIDDSEQVSRRYHVQGIPSLFLIDRAGKVQFAQEGMSPALEPLLETEIAVVDGEGKQPAPSASSGKDTP
jgi:peroxiredoxin